MSWGELEEQHVIAGMASLFSMLEKQHASAGVASPFVHSRGKIG